MNTIRRTILALSMVACVLLLLAASALAYLPSEVSGTPTPQEVVALRTENSKTFDNGDGTRTLVSYMGPIHYKDNYSDQNEAWKDIDLTLVGGKITKAPYILEIDSTNMSITITDKKTGSVSTATLLTTGGKVVDKTKSKVESKDKITWSNIDVDTDLEIVAYESAVKITRVLKSDKAPTDASFSITQIGTGITLKTKAKDGDGYGVPVVSSLSAGVLTESIDKKELSGKTYPIRIDPTWQVGASTDDIRFMWWTGTGWYSGTGDTQFDAGYFSTTYYKQGDGARFTNVTVAHGATVLTSYLTLRAGASNSNTTVNTKITGDDEDNAATFSTTADLQARRGTIMGGANNNYITTAQVNWDNIGAWTSGSDYNSPDISTVVQEIIDRAGWSSGNAMALFWDDLDNRSTASSNRARLANSYDGSSSTAPKLVITYAVTPTVTTSAASSVEATTATGNGNITDTGGSNATRRGFQWDTDSGAPYANSVYEDGSFGTGAYTLSLTSLPSGTTIYYRSYAVNVNSTGYGAEQSFLTKPAAATSVAATDGTHTDKVTVTWTKATGATGYKVYEGANLLDTLGDVATYDDSAAAAGSITPGTASASDGTSLVNVVLGVSGESTSNGASRTYKVVAFNGTGDAADSNTDTGYRGVGSITYQWQRSAADSDAAYSDIIGATTDPYNDTAGASYPDGRYYKCVLGATGASNQTTTVDRGYLGLVPSVTTSAASSVEDTTATANGEITSTGDGNATERGFEWDTDSGAPYANNVHENGSYGAAAFNLPLTLLPTGTTIYIRAYATNPLGTGYGSEETFLTKPAEATAVAATDGTDTAKVVVTWTKATGASGYRVYEGVNLLNTLGDVATYDDVTAPAGTITPGAALATDGSATDKITLSVSGESTSNGASRTYKVVAFNATGDADDSNTDTGYRGVGTITYQWYISAADADAAYGILGGATTDPYNDTAAPAPSITAGTVTASDATSTAHVTLTSVGASADPGAGRYYYCVVSAAGATDQDTTHNRGFVGVGSLTFQWQRSAGDSDAAYSDLGGATTNPYDDTTGVVDPDGRYYKVVLNATGAAQQTTAADRGNKMILVVASFTITHVSDTQIDANWAIPPGADRMMVRAKYGSYPTDPGGGAAPTDGYLVYFGVGLSVSDTSMNLDVNLDKLYYRAWKVTPADVYTLYGEDFVEGIGMTMFALLFGAVALTVYMFQTRNMLLGFPSAILWGILGGFMYQQSTATWDWQYDLFFGSFGMVMFCAIAMYTLRKRDIDAPRNDRLESGKFLDEGAAARAGGNGNGSHEKEVYIDEPSVPSRRTQELHERAAARKTGGRTKLPWNQFR